jgi:two-component system NtrC family sensor kinase
MNLVPKLSLAFVAGVSIVLGTNGYLRVQREVALFDADRARDEVVIGETLAPAVQTVWSTDGEAHALAMVTDADRRDDRVQVRWVWLDDPTMKIPPDRAAQLRVTYVPVAVPATRPGALEISQSLAPEQAYVHKTILESVVAALVLDAFCVALAYLLGAWIVGRPVAALSDKAKRVGQGDFGKPLILPQRDELARLAGDLNAMCDQLVEANAAAAREAKARITMLEQLRHADRLMTIGKLASGVAHEIGTPLNVVEARAQMIAEGATSPAESIEYARVIVRGAERIARIIRQLLTFARRESAQKARCELSTLVRHTAEMLEPLASKRNVQLRIEGEEPCAVEADGAQVEQVLTNLVMNAIQATDETRGGAVDIRFALVRATPPADLAGLEGDFARVQVRDEGSGIRPEDLSHVFEPFFTTKDVGEGTGLGLSISYGIAREHGGWLQVESAVDRGTELSLYLPRGITTEVTS